MRDHRMRFGFVPSDLLRSCASFIAFLSAVPSAEEHRFSSLCAQRSFHSAETAPKQQREEFPLGAQAKGLCSAPRCRSRRVEEHKLSICAAPIRQKSANRSYLLRVFVSKNRAGLLGQNEPREEE